MGDDDNAARHPPGAAQRAGDLRGTPSRSAMESRGRALRLRPLREDDEAAFVAAHAASSDGKFTFGSGYHPGMPWAAYLARLEDHRRGRNLPPRFVPGTFLVADVAGGCRPLLASDGNDNY